MHIGWKRPGTTPKGLPRGPRRDPKLGLASCQNSSQNTHGRNKSMSRTWADFGQNSSLSLQKVTDSTVLRINLENHVRESLRRGLIPRRKSKNWNSSLTLLKGQLK